MSTLATRTGLPPALQALADELPRAQWAAHPEFQGLVTFWLDRHAMFRELTDRLGGAAEALADRTRDPGASARDIGRYGNLLLGNLHQHHTIEDQHFFPALTGLDPRLPAGIDILETDHEALDAALASFAKAANAVISAGDDARTALSGFEAETAALTRLLDRHLEDEEDLLVPVLLRGGAAAIG